MHKLVAVIFGNQLELADDAPSDFSVRYRRFDGAEDDTRRSWPTNK